jgi:hypothetical protein
MDRPKILHSLYSEDTVKKLEEICNSQTFPWYFYHEFQFTHTLFCAKEKIESEFWKEFQPLLEPAVKKAGLEVVDIFRAKVNLSTHTFSPDGFTHHMHTDKKNSDYWTFLYYVNESDGETVFETNKKNKFQKVSPEKGKCIVFPSTLPHAASSPVYYPRRIIVNIVFRTRTEAVV